MHKVVVSTGAVHVDAGEPIGLREQLGDEGLEQLVVAGGVDYY